MNDSTLALIFTNCFPNPLDTTVHFTDAKATADIDSFVVTGDINAMWLRDATNQLLPSASFLQEDQKMQRMFIGAINREARSVLIDPYANAFTHHSEGSPWKTDDRIPKMTKDLWEGKYELDSLCAFLSLSASFYEHTGLGTPFDDRWAKAVQTVVHVFTLMQASSMETLAAPAYQFSRQTGNPLDTLQGQTGAPAARCGLIRSAFRPSDDAATYQFSIPSNAMAAVSLERVAAIFEKVRGDSATGQQLRAMAAQLRAAIASQGIVTRNGATVYAYEVDGFGNAIVMDDANVPSLLALPYMGFCSPQDPIYLRTRALLLSAQNPYYFKGSVMEGIGGPHAVPMKVEHEQGLILVCVFIFMFYVTDECRGIVGLGWVWPMSLILRGLTSTDDREIAACLATLRDTTDGKFFMHESIWMNDQTKWTRSWFAWANALFGELIIKVAAERPHLLH
ncbi:putative DUF1237 domain protein [Paratrimastix pyriformis]|uniref:DUF1237 domain protein n=1 Tax=Paratrimastix pyriformis TaxID=342808 RepID=A0ABQ8UNF4_9EUKA|nr:putative DUF1237 domain protein [Paratrimastix pyriformis]